MKKPVSNIASGVIEGLLFCLKTLLDRANSYLKSFLLTNIHYLLKIIYDESKISSLFCLLFQAVTIEYYPYSSPHAQQHVFRQMIEIVNFIFTLTTFIVIFTVELSTIVL